MQNAATGIGDEMDLVGTLNPSLESAMAARESAIGLAQRLVLNEKGVLALDRQP